MNQQPSEFDYVIAHNCLAWVLANNFINENQKPFEFTKHRFMQQLYADNSKDLVVMKSAQVGFSVAAILKSIHAANFLGLNIIYVLPTRNATHDFVIPKVNPMLDRNPLIKELVKNTDSINLKQIGDRFIYFRGAFHRGEAVSTTADLIVSDEHDISDQNVLMTYQSRLQASDYGWFWRFSNPSLPSFGVDELFQDSDQMHWMITCSKCKHTMYLDLEPDRQVKNHYVDRAREIYACGNCDAEISDANRQNGRWLAKYPERARRGYWINQLMVPWVSAKKILQQERDMTIDVFHNFVLGKPYQASEFLINAEAIYRANVPGAADRAEVMIGCDSGKIKHWVMGNAEGVFAYGKTTEWEEVEQLIKMYNATTVIDALPDFTVPEQLARKYPGQVFVHYYTHDTKNIDITRRKETQEGVLESDRTKLFDLLAAEITSGKIRFFQARNALDELIYHFEQIYRVVEPDTKGILRARWETKVNKEDHFAHATAYYRVARMFSLGRADSGGVKRLTPTPKPTSFHVKDGKAKVTEVMGMPMDQFIEKSLAQNKRRRIQ